MSEELKSKLCTWTQEDYDCDWFNTDCGQCFIVNEGTPSANDMRYCCYCGGKIIEELYSETDEDDQSGRTNGY